MPTAQLDPQALPPWLAIILTAAVTVAGAAGVYGSLSSDVSHLRQDVMEIKNDVKALMLKGKP